MPHCPQQEPHAAHQWFAGQCKGHNASQESHQCSGTSSLDQPCTFYAEFKTKDLKPVCHVHNPDPVFQRNRDRILSEAYRLLQERNRVESKDP